MFQSQAKAAFHQTNISPSYVPAYSNTSAGFGQPSRLNAFLAGMGATGSPEMTIASLAQPAKHQHIYNFLKTAFKNLDRDQRSLEHAATAGQNLENIHSISERFHISENLN